MMNKKHLVLLASAGAITLAGVATAQADTLEDTMERGAVQCGVSDGLPGFSAPDDEGNWQGLDVDVCRAVAAAVLGDADAVNYISLNAVERFTALQSGKSTYFHATPPGPPLVTPRWASTSLALTSMMAKALWSPATWVFPAHLNWTVPLFVFSLAPRLS
jgi:ABC-type amino acid transport substrate-binding protein